MIYFLILIIIVAVIYIFVTYNTLVKLNNSIKETFASMDVSLKKRWNLVPNLVETVKGYTKHEKMTLEQVIAIRNASYENMTMERKIDINKQLSSGISKIMILSEKYPELKANENFLQLSKELVKIEDEIASDRKKYNGFIKLYNDKVEMFPSKVVAMIFGFEIKDMYEAGKDEKNNVQINL